MVNILSCQYYGNIITSHTVWTLSWINLIKSWALRKSEKRKFLFDPKLGQLENRVLVQKQRHLFWFEPTRHEFCKINGDRRF